MKKSTSSPDVSETALTQMVIRLDKVVERMGSIDSTLTRQEANLGEHMRRTDALEKQLEPVKRHVAMAEGALKLIGIISMIVGLVAAAINLLQ